MVGIAIGRHAGSGKDTIGRLVCEELQRRGFTADAYKLAAPIYNEAITKYGMDPNVKDRELLQRIGDERTKDNPRYYVDSITRRTARLRFAGGIPVITDLRKEVEAKALKAEGLMLVELIVPPAIRATRLHKRDGYQFDATTLNHWTERDLDGFDGWHVQVDNWLRAATLNATCIVDKFVVNFTDVWERDRIGYQRYSQAA